MSEEKYIDDILKFLADKEGQSIRPRKLARRMGVSDDDYGNFRAAFKKLREKGRIVLGAKNALILPSAVKTVKGRFQANPKGFGFVVPSDPKKRGDLFIPKGRTGGAMTGDLVLARRFRQQEEEPDKRYTGEILEILERGITEVVGTLHKSEETWFVIPDGVSSPPAVAIRDLAKSHAKAGVKVLVEIVSYPRTGRGIPEGAVVERLGLSGALKTEIDSVIRSLGILEAFSKAALSNARRAAARFDPDRASDREDLTALTTVTVDPDTARDFDDAVSLERRPKGGFRLGVHIADVSHFVQPGTALDREAFARGTSIYFPRHVVPMLPTVLSNGVCSLQEGVRRFAKSVFIDYDNKGHVQKTRFTEAVVQSDKRLTYEAAQRIIDGESSGVSKKVVSLVKAMNDLAKRIEQRRKAAGMLHLALPEVELVLDDNGKVEGAVPTDTSYTHKIIEMFMVEANEAVASWFHDHDIPIVRRIHPVPEEESMEELRRFVAACGHCLPKKPTPKDLQELTASAEDRPEAYAVNLALLRAFQRAVYSVETEPHFALGSAHYCHFTSPIRRYADLTVHRMLEFRLRSKQKSKPIDEQYQKALGGVAAHLSQRERVAQEAEQELRLVMVLHRLAERRGEGFFGVITGVTDFGIFVQCPEFLVEGLVRLQNLGDDWWNVFSGKGRIVGEITGKIYKIGDTVEVRIDRVDIPKRHLDLTLTETPERPGRKEPRRAKKATGRRRR